jgi:hypothetical protein
MWIETKKIFYDLIEKHFGQNINLIQNYSISNIKKTILAEQRILTNKGQQIQITANARLNLEVKNNLDNTIKTIEKIFINQEYEYGRYKIGTNISNIREYNDLNGKEPVNICINIDIEYRKNTMIEDEKNEKNNT